MPTPEPGSERVVRARIARRLVVLSAARALAREDSFFLARSPLRVGGYLRFLSDLVRSAAGLETLFQKIVPAAVPDPGRLYRRREFLARNGPTGAVHWPLTIKHRLRSPEGSGLETVCVAGSRVLDAPENVLLAVTLIEASERATLIAGPNQATVLSRDDHRMLARVRVNSASGLGQRFLAALLPAAHGVRRRGATAVAALETEVAGRLRGRLAVAPPWAAALLRLRRLLHGLATDSRDADVPLGALYSLSCGLDTLAFLRDEVDLRECQGLHPTLFRSMGTPRVEILDAYAPEEGSTPGWCWVVRGHGGSRVTGVQALWTDTADAFAREALFRSWEVRHEGRPVDRWVILHPFQGRQLPVLRSRPGLQLELLHMPIGAEVPPEVQARLRSLVLSA